MGEIGVPCVSDAAQPQGNGCAPQLLTGHCSALTNQLLQLDEGLFGAALRALLRRPVKRPEMASFEFAAETAAQPTRLSKRKGTS